MTVSLNTFLRLTMKVRLNQDQKIRIENAKDVAMIMQRILFRQNKLHRKKEYFWSLGLNIANDIEYIELLAIGSLNKVHIDSVEVLSFAVSKKCKKIILCHNHPSGNLTASDQDIKITKKIKEGASLLGINLLDHIIISEEEFCSMQEQELI